MLYNTWKRTTFMVFANILAVWCKTKAYVGIDLGTTFSCVAIYYPESKSYDYLTYDLPERKTIPSTIYFTGDVDKETQTPLYKVGYLANILNQEDPDPKRYIYGFKRIVGIDKIEENSYLSKFKDEVNYTVKHNTENGKGYFTVPIEVKGAKYDFTPTELSAMVLKEIKTRLDDLNLEIMSTCISTPVYFTTVQDNEVKRAGVMAGYVDPIITKEPIAACVSYVDQHVFKFDKEEKVMVFDFGGGTLDISVVEVVKEKSEDTPGSFESSVVANRFVGDNFLGGENVNTCIFNEFEAIAKSKGFSLSEVDKLRLRLFIEDLKIKLCNEQKNSTSDVTITEKFWFKDGKEIDFSLSHSRFNQLLEDRIYKRIDKLLYDNIEGLFKEDAEKGANSSDSLRRQIKNVILVGGSTRIPYIRTILKKACPNASIFDEIDADKAVGMGACKICVNSDPNSGDSSIMVLGAVPLPIGIRLADGLFEPLIQQNVAIPTESAKTFTTVYDNQTSILIDVAMGVRPIFEDNEKIGKFQVELKNKKPKGVPQITVKIEYFADYSFKVSAEGEDVTESKSVEFKSDLGKPSKDKINKILETAKKFKDQDEQVTKVLEQFRLFEAALNHFENELNLIKKNPQVNLDDFEKGYFDGILEMHNKWLTENRANKEITVADIQSEIEKLQSASKELADKVESAKSKPKTEPKPEEKKEDDSRNIL